jgi:hypothetical protein
MSRRLSPKRRGARALGILGALACLACADAPARPTTGDAARGSEVAPFFPLAVGNRWSYRVSFLGASQDHTVSIVGSDGYVFQDSRGQRFRVDRDGLRDDQRYLLRAPLERGKKWSAVIDITHTEYYEIDEVGLSVEVPAGGFAGCVRVQARTAESPEHILLAEQTYCPNVGLVRVVTYAETQGKRGPPQVRQDLVSYRVKP